MLYSGVASQMVNYYSGTSGLLLPVRNKEFYPPEFRDKSRLHYYGTLFNSIEVNSSFYKVPMASTVEKWAADVPENFKFTYKLSRDITHNKGLAFDPASVIKFMEVISFAGNKKGSLLVQVPPSIKNVHRRQMDHLLKTIRDADPDETWDIAIEFRDNSWYEETTMELLTELRMGLVVHDKLSTASGMLDTGVDFVYVRFHGPDGNYKGRYEQDFLYEYGSYVNEWLDEGKTVYAYFNNTMGDAIENLVTLRELVQPG